MKVRDFILPEYDWLVHIFYFPTWRDLPAVVDALEENESSRSVKRRAIHLLVSGEVNYAFTASNAHRRETVIVVGPAISRVDFMNTIEHECRHLVDDIALACGIGLHGEEVGYLTGTINEYLSPDVERYFCECQAIL